MTKFSKKTTGPAGENCIIGIIGPRLWEQAAYVRNLRVVSIRKEDARMDYSLYAAGAVSAAVGPHGTAPDAKVDYITADMESIVPAGPNAFGRMNSSKRETPLRNLYNGFEFLENSLKQGSKIDVIATSAGWPDNGPFSRALNQAVVRLENGKPEVPVYSMNDFSLEGKRNTFFCFDQKGPIALDGDKNNPLEGKALRNKVGIPIEGIQIACGAPSHAAFQRSLVHKAGEGAAYLGPHVVAGLFCLAKQQFANVTKKEFEKLVRATAQKATLETQEGSVSFKIPNPGLLIEAAYRQNNKRSEDGPSSFVSSKGKPPICAL